MGVVDVELAGRKFTVPFECPCCGATPDTELRITARPTGQGLDIPYCARCADHATRWDSAGVPSAGIMVLAILGSIVVAIIGPIPVALGVLVAGAIASAVLRTSRRAGAKARCGASCATPGLAIAYLGWSDVTSGFSLASPTYAARFAEANTPLLANVTPQLRTLIDGYHKARLAVPTPAVAAGVAPPPMTAREWLVRLEATRGTVARRLALARALEMIEEPQSRRDLVQAVARIELAPLYARLQRQRSAAGQRVMLAAAIDEIRADNISDELQAAELEKLEARLSELA